MKSSKDDTYLTSDVLKDVSAHFNYIGSFKGDLEELNEKMKQDKTEPDLGSVMSIGEYLIHDDKTKVLRENTVIAIYIGNGQWEKAHVAEIQAWVITYDDGKGETLDMILYNEDAAFSHYRKLCKKHDQASMTYFRDYLNQKVSK